MDNLKDEESFSPEDENGRAVEQLSLANHLSQNKVDLNEQLIKNPIATFFLRAASDALKESGVFKGDLLVVDRSANPVSGDIVIAELDDELSIRRYHQKDQKILLSTDYSHIEFSQDDQVSEIPIWGVVTSVIRSL